MAKKLSAPARYVQPYRYPSPHIPLSAIRRFARQIAQRFQPDKIILFGSYAYGQPHEESDVDLLVIMPAYDAVNQSIRICTAFDVWPFSLDLIVRTPKQIERGLKQDNWFLREIIEKGKVLYEARNGRVGAIRRRGSASGKRPGGQNATAAKRGVLPLLAPLRRSLKSLTQYAVGFRYPGVRATRRRMESALRQAERIRTALRARLGLLP
jgi:predicted nucleotidyltransferase